LRNSLDSSQLRSLTPAELERAEEAWKLDPARIRLEAFRDLLTEKLEARKTRFGV
jgi:hypothetical protein